MSDDSLNIDFGDLSVDFSKAKELPRPKEGFYTFVVDDFKWKLSKDDPNHQKGINASIVLKFAPEQLGDVTTDLEETADFSMFKAFDNVYVFFENPFGAKPFFQAVTGRDLEDEFRLGQPSDYIGERVGALLKLEPHYQDKKKMVLKIDTTSYTAV